MEANLIDPVEMRNESYHKKNTMKVYMNKNSFKPKDRLNASVAVFPISKLQFMRMLQFKSFFFLLNRIICFSFVCHNAMLKCEIRKAYLIYYTRLYISEIYNGSQKNELQLWSHSYPTANKLQQKQNRCVGKAKNSHINLKSAETVAYHIHFKCEFVANRRH